MSWFGRKKRTSVEPEAKAPVLDGTIQEQPVVKKEETPKSKSKVGFPASHGQFGHESRVPFTNFKTKFGQQG